MESLKARTLLQSSSSSPWSLSCIAAADGRVQALPSALPFAPLHVKLTSGPSTACSLLCCTSREGATGSYSRAEMRVSALPGHLSLNGDCRRAAKAVMPGSIASEHAYALRAIK